MAANLPSDCRDLSCSAGHVDTYVNIIRHKDQDIFLINKCTSIKPFFLTMTSVAVQNKLKSQRRLLIYASHRGQTSVGIAERKQETNRLCLLHEGTFFAFVKSLSRHFRLKNLSDVNNEKNFASYNYSLCCVNTYIQ